MTHRDDGGDQTLLSDNSSSPLFFSTDVTNGPDIDAGGNRWCRGAALFPAPWAGLCEMEKRLVCAVRRGWDRPVFSSSR